MEQTLDLVLPSDSFVRCHQELIELDAHSFKGPFPNTSERIETGNPLNGLELGLWEFQSKHSLSIGQY